MKKNKVNDKLLRKATDIAHNYFWLSDCPSIYRKAVEYIEKDNVIYPQKDLLSRYVALICHLCVQEEMEQDT
jgi:hypothetical protein